MEQTTKPQELCPLYVDGSKHEIPNEYIVSVKKDADYEAHHAYIKSAIAAEVEANRNDQSPSSERFVSKLSWLYQDWYSGMFSAALVAKIRQCSEVE